MTPAGWTRTKDRKPKRDKSRIMLVAVHGEYGWRVVAFPEVSADYLKHMGDTYWMAISPPEQPRPPPTKRPGPASPRSFWW